MDTDALLIELIEALQRQAAVIADQAESIGRLADSNSQLIEALADIDADEQGPDAAPRTYLDGSPCA